MTEPTGERRVKRAAAYALLGLLAVAGCTRPNPAFEPAAGEAEDAQSFIDEQPPHDAPRPDGAPSVPPDSAPMILPDAGPPPSARDAAPPLAPDAALDPGPPEVGPPGDTGLIAYWPLDEGAGNALIDRSGNGNRGDLAGVDLAVAWTAGHVGDAVEIPAIKGAAVMVSPSPSLDRTNRALTISAWVYRLESIRNHNMTVASRQMGDTNRELYNLGFQSDVLVVWLYAAAPAAQLNLRATAPAPLGQWLHVAMTWDGQTARLYQGGVAVGSVAYAGPLPPTTNPVILGNNANSTGIDQPLGGRLDEVRLYDRALSASEIAALAR